MTIEQVMEVLFYYTGSLRWLSPWMVLAAEKDTEQASSACRLTGLGHPECARTKTCSERSCGCGERGKGARRRAT